MARDEKASRDHARNFIRSNSVAGKGIDLVKKNGNRNILVFKLKNMYTKLLLTVSYKKEYLIANS